MHLRAPFSKPTYRWPTYQAWMQDRARQARERAARWRAKQKRLPRPITMTARAIIFLTENISDRTDRFRLRKSCGGR